MKSHHFLFLFSILLLLSCSNMKEKHYPFEEVNIAVDMRDSTLYGFCGEGSAMNTLQLIIDNGDTLQLSTEQAQQNGTVLGQYGVGDQLAVLVSADSTRVVSLVNLSTLQGNWVTLNPLDGYDEVGFSLREGGLAEGISQSTVAYQRWRIYNGALEMTLIREGVSELEETVDYRLLFLTGDSLAFQEGEDVYEYHRPRPKENTEIVDFEEDDIDLATL